MAGATTYQYILSLHDKMSATLKKAGYMGGKEYDKLQAKQEKLNRTADGFKSIAMKMGLAFGAFEFGKKIITAGANIEATRVSFATFLGSVEKGNAMIAQLQAYADVTPFTAETLQQSTKTLLGFGVAGDKIMPTLKMLGDISGGNAEKMQSLTLAYAQMNSAGKLMGQDLLQMVNAGFNPLSVMAKKTGRSMMDMRKEMEKGNISSAMVEEAFRSATSEGGLFYGMMDKMGKTVSGRWSTLMDAVDKTFRTWGESSNSTIGNIIDRLSSLMNFVNAHLETITKWAKRLLIFVGVWKAISISIAITGAVTTWYTKTVRKANASLFVLNKRMFGTSAAAGTYSGFMGIASLATKMFSGSIKALGKAIYAVPIFGWIAAGISVVIAGFTLLWNKSEKFRGFLFGIWEVSKIVFSGLYSTVKNVIQAIGGAFKWLREKVLQPVFEWFSNLGGFVTGLFDKIIQGLSWVFKPIVALWNKLSKSKIVLDIKEKFSTGYQKGIENFRTSKKDTSPIEDAIPGVSGGIGAGGMDVAGGAGGGIGAGGMDNAGGAGGSSSTIDELGKGIADGGNRPTNINITLGNLVETLTVTPANMKEGVNEIERMVKEALLRALNSANGVAYGN